MVDSILIVQKVAVMIGTFIQRDVSAADISVGDRYEVWVSGEDEFKTSSFCGQRVDCARCP